MWYSNCFKLKCRIIDTLKVEFVKMPTLRDECGTIRTLKLQCGAVTALNLNVVQYLF